MDNNEKKKERKDDGPSVLERFMGWLKEIRGEFKKIIWPDRKTLAKHTVNVILISGAIGAVIIVFDLLFSNGYGLFVDLFY